MRMVTCRIFRQTTLGPPIGVELYGSGNGTFDVYVAAQTNNISRTDTTVTFSLGEGCDGWQHSSDSSQKSIPIEFRLTGYKGDEDKLYCIASDNTLTITPSNS